MSNERNPYVEQEQSEEINRTNLQKNEGSEKQQDLNAKLHERYNSDSEHQEQSKLLSSVQYGDANEENNPESGLQNNDSDIIQADINQQNSETAEINNVEQAGESSNLSNVNEQTSIENQPVSPYITDLNNDTVVDDNLVNPNPSVEVNEASQEVY